MLLERNRLALVVLAANLAVVGNRARGAAAGLPPARWLARNAQALRFVLLILADLRCRPSQAGYRAIQAARRPFRRRRAPRLLRHRLDHRAVLRVVRSFGQVRERPRFVATLG